MHSGRVLVFLLFSFGPVYLFAQRATIDSLTLALAERKETDSTTIAMMIDLAYAYSQVSPDSTLNLAEKALELARKKDIRILEAWALNRIAGSYWLTAKFPKALESAQKALEIFQELDDSKGIADCLNVLASTHAMDNDLERGLYYYKLSVEQFEELGDIDAKSRGLSNIGRVYYMMGKYDSALYYMNLIKNIVEGDNNIRESIMYNTTGDIYQKTGNLDLALENYNKGLKIAEFNKIPRIITYSTRGLAEIYQTMGNISESNKYALRTLKISREIGYLENIRNAAQILSDNYKLTGNYQKAYQYFVEYSATRDSMFNMDKERELQKLEENFEIAQKQKEIELLTTEKELQEQQSKQQWIFMYGLLIIIALVVIIAVVQYRKVVLKQKTNRILTQQKNKLTQQNQDILRQREEIEKQSRLLEEANTTKDKLFSIISHDLKSPFGALLMVTEHLDKKTFSREELTNLKTDLHGKVKSLNEMLNNLLYWSRSQMKGSKVTKEEFNISEMIIKNIDVFKQVAEDKKIHISTDIEENVKAYADSNQIDCVLRNLINNSIKFTEQGGKITVGLQKLENEISVSIADNGVGIPDDIKPKLFTAGAEIHTKGTENESGSGIGLFLCKEFVEINSGTIKVESEIEKGSKFSFTVPTQPNNM